MAYEVLMRYHLHMPSYFLALLSEKTFQTINNLLIYIKLSNKTLTKRLIYENNTGNQAIEYAYQTLIIF